jgi:hypothetical protein
MKIRFAIVLIAAHAIWMRAEAQNDYKPTPQEAQAARANAQRDAKLADEMEKARLKQEAAAPKAVILPGRPAAKASAPRTAAADPKKKKKVDSKAQDFTAVSPGEGKRKKKEKEKS